MLSLGPLAFTAPWLLLGLMVLPILWLLLRARGHDATATLLRRVEARAAGSSEDT